MRKGLSPLIATIVLIALVLTIGTTLAVYINNIIARSSDSDTTCGTTANYILESAEFNRSGDGRLVIKLTNKDRGSLYGFGVELQNSTDIVSFPDGSPEITMSPSISISNPLEQEESVLIKIDLSSHAAMASSMTVAKVKNGACPDVSASVDSIQKY